MERTREQRVEKTKRKRISIAPFVVFGAVGALAAGVLLSNPSKYLPQPTNIEKCDDGDRDTGRNVPEVGFATIAPERRMGALNLMYKAAVQLRTDMKPALESRDPGNTFDLFVPADDVDSTYQDAAKDFFVKQDGGYNLYDTRKTSHSKTSVYTRQRPLTVGDMPDNNLNSSHEVLCRDTDGFHFTEDASQALIDLNQAGVEFKSNSATIAESVEMLANGS